MNDKRRWIRMGLVAVAATGALMIGGALILPLGQATAGLFGGHHGRHGPEAMREKAGFVAEWVLHRVDATDEQQAEVAAILDRTVAELAPLHEGREEDRAAFVAALTGASVDRTALEELRAEKVAEMSVVSEELLASLVDIAEILTPEQREELAALADRWHH